MSERRRQFLRYLGAALVACVTLAAAWRAYEKGRAGQPEWSYHRAAAQSAFEGTLSQPGYLPGIVFLIRPFFQLPEPVGLPLFIVLAVVSAVSAFRLLWRELAAEIPAMPARPGPWHGLWLAAPFYFAIQNNQVMAQTMLCLVLGLALIRRQRWTGGTAVLALSVLLKTLPITLVPYFLLQRRFRIAILLAVFSAAATFGLASLVYGVADSWEIHATWPLRLTDQEPTNALKGDARMPRYFDDNQSAAAWIVRGAALYGRRPAIVLRYALFWVSLLATVWVLLRRRRTGCSPGWADLSLWLCWTVFAAPFGRYYYAILLLPAWMLLAYAPRKGARGSRLERASGFALGLLAWTGRTSGAFPLLAGATFLLTLRRLAAIEPAERFESGDGSVCR